MNKHAIFENETEANEVKSDLKVFGLVGAVGLALVVSGCAITDTRFDYELADYLPLSVLSLSSGVGFLVSAGASAVERIVSSEIL